MSTSTTSCPAEGPARGSMFPAAWREPFLLSPKALHVFFLVYALNCIVFYQDRMLLDTTEWLNSHLLAYGTFWTSHGRFFSQAPPQVLPWLAIQIGLPLKGVALAYSLGYCLYHYLMALLLFYGFRRRDLAALLLFIIAIYLVHDNFYMQAEPMQLAPWALCTLAILQRPTQTSFGRMLAALGVALFALITVSSHPYGLPLLLAFGGYAFFRSDHRKQLLPAIIVMIVTLAAFYAYHKAYMDSYERKRLSQVGLEMLRANGLDFARYFLFAHTFALGGIALLTAQGLIHRALRASYWFSALCMLGYATMIASFSPLFLHPYHWYCLIPMYAIMGAPFFDAHGTKPSMGGFARVFLAIAILWAFIGIAADLTAFRERGSFQTNLVNALSEEGKRRFIVDPKRLSLDYPKSILAQWYLAEETSTRTAFADPSRITTLLPKNLYRDNYWMFSTTKSQSRYLPWFPLKKSDFISAIVPVPRTAIQQRAAQIKLDYPEHPTSLRVVNGWLCNYARPPKLVYSVPVTVTNSGSQTFPACDTENTIVMFGYYWQRDGKIIYEDLQAEYLPIDVKSTFHHVLNVQRGGIPRDARLTIDLFLHGRPLLYPDLYDSLIPCGQTQ